MKNKKMKTKSITMAIAYLHIVGIVCSSAEAQTIRERLQERLSGRSAQATPKQLEAEDVQSTESAIRISPQFEAGTRCMFIGHSFFIPIARAFDGLAKRGEFAQHDAELIFSPGVGGSPGGLWKDKDRRKQIEAKLSSGTVTLFGMPTASSRSKSPLKDLRNWVELATKYNPKTTFLIGQPWPAGGPRMDAGQYSQVSAKATRTNFQAVTQLRREFPDNRFIFIDYGRLAADMKSQFLSSNLPEITDSVGRGSESLFRDYFMGHAGQLMTELSAIVWLKTLYVSVPDANNRKSLSTEAKSIVEATLSHNRKFR
ncbi:MAG: hypothetical protein AAF483_12870 [Planctomycetota bacterium]